MANRLALKWDGYKPPAKLLRKGKYLSGSEILDRLHGKD